MHGSESDSDTADLCRRCAEGDEDAFSEVYRRFGGVLYGTAWRILRSPQEAEEVVQEAFLTLYRKAGDDPPRNLGGWLHRVTVNRSLDRIRSRTRRAEVELNEAVHAGDVVSMDGTAISNGGDTVSSSGLAATAAGADHGFSLDIERGIDRLPERMRMVFVLHDVEGFKHREVGELMGISDGSSKSQLFRARNMLRGWLQQEGAR
jgi:RNA polymerase sigma-70 factor (ECF subfamily)